MCDNNDLGNVDAKYWAERIKNVESKKALLEGKGNAHQISTIKFIQLIFSPSPSSSNIGDSNVVNNIVNNLPIVAEAAFPAVIEAIQAEAVDIVIAVPIEIEAYEAPQDEDLEVQVVQQAVEEVIHEADVQNLINPTPLQQQQMSTCLERMGLREDITNVVTLNTTRASYIMHITWFLAIVKQRHFPQAMFIDFYLDNFVYQGFVRLAKGQ